MATTPRRTNIGLMIFDIDHFKRVNDRRGHDTGDRVLKSMAKLISINTRDSDLVGRWGGEEFLHISSDIQKSNLMELAEKLRNAVAFYTFEENDPLTITISIGVTLFRKDEPFLKALKRADDALYAAKNNGRNCCVFQD
ncbi:GGDEF domain-containing protein [Teredinibacter purpureus]|uniref:GGDEF domain-containing protein n=1 Tax=Teredinibacter purpureus TaxID=2731756 RepID=UPI00228734EE|nr:GGDEF domain-containing protein [Teredinibacter purpureus]